MIDKCVKDIEEGASGNDFRLICSKIDTYLRNKARRRLSATHRPDDDDDDSNDDDDSLDAQPNITPIQSLRLDCSDEDEDDEAVDDTMLSIGTRIKNAWGRRRKKLISDYAITAWLLSPVKEIMADANEHHTGDDREAVNRLLTKLLVVPCATEAATDLAKGQVMNSFWEEFEQFHSRTGPFANKPHIWNSKDLNTNQSHVWHKKNSLRYTEVLGQLACLVCSKILGIGSAERCWGDVKQNKNGKRSHLSAEAVKMQATIFGTYSAEKANIERTRKDSAAHFWDDDDFRGLGLSRYGVDVDHLVKVPTRIFRAWLEEWEEEILYENDPVHQARLLEKYGGMAWHDPDFDQMLTASCDRMYFSRKRGERGYCVYGLKDGWCEGHTDDADTWEPWALNADLYGQIAEFYELNPHPTIQIVRQNEETATEEMR